MWDVAFDATSGDGAGFKCIDSLRELLEICRTFFLCAGRTIEDGRDEWKAKSSQLTLRLANSLQSISYPEKDVDTTDVFRAQCALDMAMKLHTKLPGIVDESLLQALHGCSIKTFNALANNWGWYKCGDIKR